MTATSYNVFILKYFSTFIVNKNNINNLANYYLFVDNFVSRFNPEDVWIQLINKRCFVTVHYEFKSTTKRIVSVFILFLRTNWVFWLGRKVRIKL
jgi:hypothetical protein